jgi:hypothetical protein
MLTRRIRALRPHAASTIVALTGLNTRDITERAMNRFSMSRDWLAVLLALLAVVLVKLGVIDGVPW